MRANASGIFNQNIAWILFVMAPPFWMHCNICSIQYTNTSTIKFYMLSCMHLLCRNCMKHTGKFKFSNIHWMKFNNFLYLLQPKEAINALFAKKLSHLRKWQRHVIYSIHLLKHLNSVTCIISASPKSEELFSAQYHKHSCWASKDDQVSALPSDTLV